MAPRLRADLTKVMWVSRFEFRTAEDLDRIMAHCARAGFGAVMLQVRGNGTVAFASRREGWARELGAVPPGFDPLAHAVRAAHAHRLKLHAWINMVPGWRGKDAPADPQQLFRRHPEWFLRNRAGGLVREHGPDGYAWLNPCLPQVRVYLAELCEEIATRYAVDGLHLDHIRFPHGGGSSESPGDAVSWADFARQAGSRRDDPAEFARWKAGAVTDIVRRVRRRLDRLPRRMALTAAVNADLHAARGELAQDWPRWSRDRLVDAVMPMNYTPDDGLFVTRARECVRAAAGLPVVMGVGVYRHREAHLPASATIGQMDAALRAGAVGVALYSYGSSFAAELAPQITAWNGAR
ncbi:MAG: family 10 glycosylhydrolase [Planctomycetes bacterium]|nr:family 10 glycosylhydrolase [Planctomycetota bacterium]